MITNENLWQQKQAETLYLSSRGAIVTTTITCNEGRATTVASIFLCCVIIPEQKSYKYITKQKFVVYPRNKNVSREIEFNFECEKLKTQKESS